MAPGFFGKSLVFVIVLSALLVVSFLLFLAPASNNQQKYKIGVILPLTGHFAFYGEKALQGAELSQKRFPFIELIVEDDQGEPSKAVSAANKLIYLDQVDALITARSSISVAVAPVAQQGNVPLLYSSTVDLPAEENSLVFKNFINIKEDCRALARLLQGKEGRLLGLAIDSTLVCIEAFKEEGFDLEPEIFEESESDFRSRLFKIRESAPDFLVIRASEKTLAVILKQMKELDFRVLIVCPHITGSGCNVSEFLEGFPGLFYSALGSDAYASESSSLSDFVSLFLGEFGSEPIDLSYAFYENTAILAESLKKCTGSKACLLEELNSVSFNGLEGPLSFNKKGIVERPSNIVGFNGLSWVPLQ